MPAKIGSLSPVADRDDVASPSPVPSDRPSDVRRIASVAHFEERAPDQLAGYFARSQGGEPLRPEDTDVEAKAARRRARAGAR